METLQVERSDGVVVLTLDRPQTKNAVTRQMWRELIAVFDEVASRTEDRALLITGAGDGFCTGADLSDPEAAPGSVGGALDGMRLVSATARRLFDLTKPTVAAVNGVAAGAGCNLALGCDLVVASERARFIEIFTKRGLVVDFGGSWLLPRLVGLHQAKEMILLADPVPAADALRLGLVNRVVPHEQLMDEAFALAARLAAGPPLALALSKQLLNQAHSVSFAEALEAENVAQSLMFGSKDTAEAVIAFFEKREPRFTGE